MSEFEQYRADYERDGFVVIPQFLTGDDFTELTSELDRYIADVVPTLPDSAAFFQDRKSPETLKQMQHMQDQYFVDYAEHPRWKQLAETLFGEPAFSKRPEWFNKPPNTDHETPPHQDNYYINLDPPPLTAWLALDPVDDENGCLRYCVGSHKKGLRPHETTRVLGFSQGIADFDAATEENEVAVHMQPGDLAVHHGELIHRADPNRTSDRQRRAFAMVFQTAAAQLNQEAYARHTVAAREQHQGMGLEVD